MLKLIPCFLVCITLFSFGCEKSTTPPQSPTFYEIQGENGFVGELTGTDAFVSLMLGTEEAVVYVCNGSENISEWFSGKISDPTSFDLSNLAGAKISVAYIKKQMEGTVTLSNQTTYAFTAKPNTNILGGIYKAMGDEVKADSVQAGWILNSDAQERGSLKVRSVNQPVRALPKANFTFNNKSYPVFRYRLTPSTPLGVPIPYPNTGK